MFDVAMPPCLRKSMVGVDARATATPPPRDTPGGGYRGYRRPKFLAPLPSSRTAKMPTELVNMKKAVWLFFGRDAAVRFLDVVPCTRCCVPWSRHAVGGIGCPGFGVPTSGNGYGSCVTCGLPLLFHRDAAKFHSFAWTQHGRPTPVSHEFASTPLTILGFLQRDSPTTTE